MIRSPSDPAADSPIPAGRTPAPGRLGRDGPGPGLQLPQKEGTHHGRVHDLAPRHHAAGIFHADQLDGYVFGRVQLGLAQKTYTPSQEHVHMVGEDRRQRRKTSEFPPLTAAVAGLLTQFGAGGLLRRHPGVDQTAGQLQGHLSEAVTELPHQHEPTVLGQRHHRHPIRRLQHDEIVLLSGAGRHGGIPTHAEHTEVTLDL